MNNRIVYLGAGLALAMLVILAMVLLLAASLVAAAPIERGAAPAGDPAGISVSRAISIPFGIDSPLALVQEGNAVLVSGHGMCPEGGERYQLRTTVEQDGTRAMGFTEGDCAGGAALTWQALATTPPPQQFQPGPAEACGMVQVFFPREGAIVHRWCLDVTLQ